MTCFKCGKDNPSDATFCNGCGMSMARPVSYQGAMQDGGGMSMKTKWIICGVGFLIFAALIAGSPHMLDTPQSTSTPVQATSPEAITPDHGKPAAVPDLPPATMRDRLASNYVSVISAANPHFNFIKSSLTKMKDGFALWAVHSLFTQSSFDVGDDAKMVQQWINLNYTDLKKAEIKRVGFKNESGYLGYCYFDLK